MSWTDTIPWSPDRPLLWSDFKADVNPAVYEDAYSAVGYRPEWTVGSVREDNGDGAGDKILFVIADLHIFTEFRPALSWARPLCGDLELRHQQGHFDLGEYTMREVLSDIRDSLYGRRFPTRGKNEDQRRQLAKEDSVLVIEPAMRVLRDRLEAAQTEYDTVTDHGCDTRAQSKYDDKFATLRL